MNKQVDIVFTALHYAKMQSFDVIANLLLSHGANSHIKNDFGQLGR